MIKMKESRRGTAFPKTLWCLKCHSEVVVLTLQDMKCSCTRARAKSIKKLYAEQLFVNTGEGVSSDYIWEGEVNIPYWVEIDSEEAKREIEERKKQIEQREQEEKQKKQKLVEKWEKEIGKPLLDWFSELSKEKQEEIRMILDPYDACFGDIENLNYPELELARALEKREIKGGEK